MPAGYGQCVACVNGLLACSPEPSSLNRALSLWPLGLQSPGGLPGASLCATCQGLHCVPFARACRLRKWAHGNGLACTLSTSYILKLQVDLLRHTSPLQGDGGGGSTGPAAVRNSRACAGASAAAGQAGAGDVCAQHEAAAEAGECHDWQQGSDWPAGEAAPKALMMLEQALSRGGASETEVHS